MKITGLNYGNEALRVPSKSISPKIKEDSSAGVKRADKVSISSSDAVESSAVQGYSPENMKLERSSDLRAEKIARIKEDIDQNRYEVSSEKVAEKLIGSHVDELV